MSSELHPAPLIVIATTRNDIHAAAVAVALNGLGIRNIRWMSSDLPTGQRTSIDIVNGNLSAASDDLAFSIDLNTQGSVFWNRRIASELAMPTELHPADEQIALRESRYFRDSIAALLNTASISVNDVYAARRAENKALQLLLAQRNGFEIPKTLISNDPTVVKTFLKQSPEAAIIAKPFRHSVWKGLDRDVVSHSALVRETDLPSDPIFQACPMIFQTYVDKAFEVRITCLGSTLIAVKLDSQRNERSKVDWRAVSPTELNVCLLELPTHIEAQCFKLLAGLGIIFGCIDMIITTHGEWIFLEINQMGQFLWIEEANPDIPMLDIFIQFLVNPQATERITSFSGIRFQEIKEQAHRLLDNELPYRVKTPVTDVVEEVRR